MRHSTKSFQGGKKLIEEILYLKATVEKNRGFAQTRRSETQGPFFCISEQPMNAGDESQTRSVRVSEHPFSSRFSAAYTGTPEEVRTAVPKQFRWRV
jgi:hypothetical protein